MSHFLRVSERPHQPFVLHTPRAAVPVEVRANGAELHVVVDEKTGLPFVVAKGDVEWTPLPERCAVIHLNGKRVLPSAGRRFYVSVGTFDPHHLVMEYE